ncbi:hypothetical protein TIFTF001_027947 [Ficus carica]|uniref:Uncharacterized protein n=1 Tax=Ficus carica TaxID=3494 RepID=A0AA88DNW9_FICCA|nr:hypothetical protein TIFTF001_027947 [Ficus carica]
MIDGKWWWWRPTVVYRLFLERSNLILVHCSYCIDVKMSGQHSVMSKYIMNFARRFLKNGHGSVSFHDCFLETVMEASCFHDGLLRPTVVEGPCFHDGLWRPSWKPRLQRQFLKTIVEARSFHDGFRSPSWKPRLPPRFLETVFRLVFLPNFPRPFFKKGRGSSVMESEFCTSARSYSKFGCLEVSGKRGKAKHKL